MRAPAGGTSFPARDPEQVAQIAAAMRALAGGTSFPARDPEQAAQIVAAMRAPAGGTSFPAALRARGRPENAALAGNVPADVPVSPVFCRGAA